MIRSIATALSLSLLTSLAGVGWLTGCTSASDGSRSGDVAGGASASGGAAPVSSGGSLMASAGAGTSAGGASAAGGVSSNPGGAGAGGTTPPSMRVIGYLPNWYGAYASWVTKVDFSKLTQINLAFALGGPTANLQLAGDADLDTFVSAAHAKGVKVFPSLCGGSGDPTFAPYYAADQVDSLVDRIITVVLARKFDGIDVDVEAPEKMGTSYDTFIAKLKAKATPLGLPVTAAVASWMQDGMSDATLLSFDFINVMSYDATGTWTDPGEHSSYQQSLDDLDYYVKKGVAKDKIVLGAPMYGYCWGNCGAGQTKLYVLYKDILAKYPDAASKDWIDSNGTQYSYNGVATMAKKTTLAAQYGGLMLWELGGDVPVTNADSLLLTISKTAH